jgi:hypothetical protein
MVINGLPVSSLFCYTVLLCLPHCLHAHLLAPFVLLPFMLCAPCLFKMHHSSSVHSSCCTLTHSTHLKNVQLPHLFFVIYTYSLCSPCACYLSMLLHAFSISNSLPHHHANSSASLAVKCMRPSSLGVISRFLRLSSSRDTSSYLL